MHCCGPKCCVEIGLCISSPQQRPVCWFICKPRRRLKSVIVLTTHSMEEADLLCDDIHIMAEGRLAASGSPLSLKARYGVGYTLTVVLQHHQQPKQQPGAAAAGLQHGTAHGSSSSLCSSSSAGSFSQQQGRVTPGQAAQAVVQLVQQHIPSAQLLSAAGCEVSIRLPKEQAADFPTALRALDAAAYQLGVSSYGLSVTTLEEVFLAIADQAVAMSHTGSGDRPQQQQYQLGRLQQPQQAASTQANGIGKGHTLKLSSSRPATTATAAMQSVSPAAEGLEAQAGPGCQGGQQPEVLSGMALYWQQVRALLVKRALCARWDAARV